MKKNNNGLIKKYTKIATEVRKKLLQMHAQAESSHIGSSLSVVDILVTLYFHILKISPRRPCAINRDRFILSKGHAASVLYAVLAKRGFFPQKLLNRYYIDGGKLPGHVTINCAPGIEVSTGSLGHGFSMGIGMALAARHNKRNYRIFVILSDGECQEGSVWEAAMFASQHKLDNLIVIIDYNKLQAFGRIKEVVDLEPFSGKWNSFGWMTKEIDGHNFGEIIKTLEKVPFKKGKPSVIIAHTVKGKGVSFMENQIAWHYKSPNPGELEIALKELGLL